MSFEEELPSAASPTRSWSLWRCRSPRSWMVWWQLHSWKENVPCAVPVESVDVLVSSSSSLSRPVSFSAIFFCRGNLCLQLLTVWGRFRKVIVTIMFCNHKIFNPEICFLVTFSCLITAAIKKRSLETTAAL